MRLRTRASERLRAFATRLAWNRALATEMSGSRPDADAVTASTGTFVARPSPFSSRYARVRCGTVLASQTYDPSPFFLYFVSAVGLTTAFPALSSGRQ